MTIETEETRGRGRLGLLLGAERPLNATRDVREGERGEREEKRESGGAVASPTPRAPRHHPPTP
eukprot:scaffold158999_cov22-Tisochrysis_lutea.AAC.1